MGIKGIKKVPTDFGVDGFHSISLNNFLSEDDPVVVKKWEEDDDKKAMAMNTKKRPSSSSLLDMLADVATKQSSKALQEEEDGYLNLVRDNGPETKWVFDEKAVVEEFIKFCAQKARQERVLADKGCFYIPKKKRSRCLRIKRRTYLFMQFGSDHNHLPVYMKPLKRKREFNSDDNTNLEKTQKRVQFESKKLEPPPDLPRELKDKIGCINGGDLKLVIQKRICASDLSNNNARFSIPMTKAISPDFVKEREKRDLEIRNNNRLVGIPVFMLNPTDLSFDPLHLKKWKMGENDVYNLVSGWIKVAKANRLEKDEIVQLWSFRLDLDSRLCFVLVKVSTTTEEDHRHIRSTSCASPVKSSISGGSTSCLSNEY